MPLSNDQINAILRESAQISKLAKNPEKIHRIGKERRTLCKGGCGRRISVITDRKSRNYSNVTPSSRKRLLALKRLHMLRASTDRISGRYIYCRMEE